MFKNVRPYPKKCRAEILAESGAGGRIPEVAGPGGNPPAGLGPQEDEQHRPGQLGLEVLGQEKLSSGRTGRGPSCGNHEAQERCQESYLRCFSLDLRESPPPRFGYKSVQMDCPYHSEGHSVSLAVFLLFEKVEAAFGTTLLTVEDLHLA